MRLESFIRDIPDFPKPGIVFKDITPLLLDAGALDAAVSQIADYARPRGVDLVLAAEARGFILGAAVARELGVGFVPARKPGKLPGATVSAEYILEYGVDALEMHADALADGPRVLLHDAACRAEHGLSFEGEAAAAYVEAIELSRFGGPAGVQILGGHGFMQDHPVEKSRREARALGLLLGGVDRAREDAGRALLAAALPIELSPFAEGEG